MQYTWDRVKAARNLRDHGVSFEEAATVLESELAQFRPDPRGAEDRVNAIGYSGRGRVLFVVVLEREAGETLRIISARKATAWERDQYEQGTF